MPRGPAVSPDPRLTALPPPPAAVLVHCGAGVSRSATLVIMYLMRHNHWSAQKAKEHCVARRSIVCPNDGFWRTLCALEDSLGIADRWVGGWVVRWLSGWLPGQLGWSVPGWHR